MSFTVKRFLGFAVGKFHPVMASRPGAAEAGIGVIFSSIGPA